MVFQLFTGINVSKIVFLHSIGMLNTSKFSCSDTKLLFMSPGIYSTETISEFATESRFTIKLEIVYKIFFLSFREYVRMIISL